MVVRYVDDCWIRIVPVARFAALTAFSVAGYAYTHNNNNNNGTHVKLILFRVCVQSSLDVQRNSILSGKGFYECGESADRVTQEYYWSKYIIN